MRELGDRVLLPHEVAAMAGVDPRTVTRWANAGKLPSFLTLGGQRRFYKKQVVKALEEWAANHESGDS
jgi:excisionase family DNA binding protein